MFDLAKDAKIFKIFHYGQVFFLEFFKSAKLMNNYSVDKIYPICAYYIDIRYWDCYLLS